MGFSCARRQVVFVFSVLSSPLTVFPLHDVVDYHVWRNETTAHNLFRPINYGDIRVYFLLCRAVVDACVQQQLCSSRVLFLSRFYKLSKTGRNLERYITATHNFSVKGATRRNQRA